MAVAVWTVQEFREQLHQHAGKEFAVDNPARHTWLASVLGLAERAHARGDGIAVYANHDLSSPDIGQLRIVSYGSEASQLETRYREWIGERTAYSHFTHAEDILPTTLPDIGGMINWRYQLEAVVPAAPKAFNDPTVECCERDAADCDCTTELELPTAALFELRRVWRTGDDELLQRRIVSLVRDIFGGIDGDLQTLTDL